MRTAHIADIHISDSRIEEFELMLQKLGEDIKSHSPDLVVFSGDMFIHRDKLSPKQVQLTRKFFHKILDGLKVLIIPGNHDASMSEQKVDSLTAIFSHDANIKVYNYVGDFIDIGNYRYHAFPYPSKIELIRLEIDDIAKIYSDNRLFDSFQLSDDKKNVLLYHGVLENFKLAGYIASEEAIGVGKEMVIPESFWKKFDAVLAGHLHGHQQIGSAVYPGCPFPLTYADSEDTGWVLWEDCTPTFITLEKEYPYTTLDIGNLSTYKAGINQEAELRLKKIPNLKNTRLRVKYTLMESQAGELDHTIIGKFYSGAKEIKIQPVHKPDRFTISPLELSTFKDSSLQGIIDNHIKELNYNPEVKTISDKIEERVKSQYKDEKDTGIHFKPSKLRLKNFKCFGEDSPEVDFGTLSSVVGVFGKNRTGKSSLVEAIIWALFGTTVRNNDVRSVIRNGQTSCVVELEFFSQAALYKIYRERRGSGLTTNSSLLLYKWINDNWVDVSGAGVNDTQKTISELVGTLEMFVSTVYSPQNGIDRLVNKKPSERKQIILDCLQIDVLERRQKEILKLKSEVTATINTLKGQLVAYSSQLDRLLSNKPELIITEFESLLRNEKINQQQLLSKIESLSSKLSDYTELQAENEKINTTLSELRKEIVELQKKQSNKKEEVERFKAIASDKTVIERGLQRLKIYKEELEKHVKNFADLTKAKNEKTQFEKQLEELSRAHRNTISALNTSKNALIQQLHSYTELDCPKPDCPLNLKVQKEKDKIRVKMEEADNAIVLARTEQEIVINQIKEKIISLQSDIDNSNYSSKEHLACVSAFNEENNNKWHELEAKINSKEEVLSNMLELITAYGRQVSSLIDKRDELVRRRTVLAEKLATIDSYKYELETARLNLSECNKKISKCESHISKAKHDIEDTKRLRSEVGQIDTKLKKAELYYTHCAHYAEIVSKKGIVFQIVDKALPTIEKFAQNLLSETTSGSLSIQVTNHKDNSTAKDNVMIQITDAKGTRDILESSGSELFLASLALRAAMSHLLSLRTGSKVEMFVIDEGMGVLDDEGIVIAKDMFKQLGKEFNQVLFITHVGELKDVAQSIIEIYSDNLISNFNIKDKMV